MFKIIKILIVVVGITGIALYLLSLASGKEKSLATQFITNVSTQKSSVAYEQFSEELKDVQPFLAFENKISSLKLNPSCRLKIDVKVGTNVSTSTGVQREVAGVVKCDTKELSASFKYNNQSKLTSYRLTLK